MAIKTIPVYYHCKLVGYSEIDFDTLYKVLAQTENLYGDIIFTDKDFKAEFLDISNKSIVCSIEMSASFVSIEFKPKNN